MNRATVATVFGAFSLLATTSETRADAKNFPGSVCVRWSGSSSVAYYYSAIGNASTHSSLYLDCPVTKDLSRVNTSGNHFAAKDRSASNGVQCSLMSMRVEYDCSVSGWSSGSRTTLGNLNRWQIVSTDHDPGSVVSSDRGYYFFSCKIPPKATDISYILMLRVDEVSS